MTEKKFKELIKWSHTHFSDLPWRLNRTVYRTLVSEIMLQQTTVGTVKNHFDRFLKRFPNINSLAQATEAELLIEWKGLGYYRRAKNLRKIALQIHELHKNNFPLTEAELLELNGVGNYTANALLAIGMDKKAIALDANLERVISRLFAIEEVKGPKLIKKIYELFKHEEILNFKNISYRDLNEALMDLGRVYCKANTVECQNCHLQSICRANLKREQLQYPKTDAKKTKKASYHLEVIRVVVLKNKKILAYEKAEKEWLHGQWELPTYILKSEDKLLKQYPHSPIEIDQTKFPKFKTAITNYKITNYVLAMSESEFKKKMKKADGKKYVFVENDRDSNLSTASVKAINKL